MIKPTYTDGPGIPFSNAYWVVPGRLMAGGYPLAHDPDQSGKRLTALFDHGIRDIIDLTEPEEILRLGSDHPPYEQMVEEIGVKMGIDAKHHRFPIGDFSVPSQEIMIQILDLIDHSLAHDRPVYVHCWAGVGRTGTVVGCYLRRQGHPPGISLLDTLYQLRKNTRMAMLPSPQTPEQTQLVLSWHEGQ